MTHKLAPSLSRSLAHVRALAARVSPREYLKGIVIEAIQDERREGNLRALEYEAALAASMARHPSGRHNPYAPFGRDPDEGGR